MSRTKIFFKELSSLTLISGGGLQDFHNIAHRDADLVQILPNQRLKRA